MRRSSLGSLGARFRSGITLCAALSLAVWLCPFSPAYGEDHEVGKPGRPNSADQLAQNTIVVPSRVIKIPRGKTVFERQRPELDPLGIRMGGFILYPSLAVSEEYNDNIFTTDTGTIDDFITRITPKVSLKSNWNNHALNFFGGRDIARHLDNSAEDWEDFNVGTTGRLDVRRNTQIRARAEFQNRHVERSDPDDTGAAEPTEYDVYIGQLEGFQRFNRLNFTLGGSIERQDYDDDVATNNDDRDRNDIEVSLRAGYEIVPQYEAFVRTAYSIREYDDGFDDAGLDRDSEGYDVVAGVAVDFGGILFGDFFAGYMSRDYDDILLNSIDGPTVGAEITWNVTPLTTFIGTIKREILESTSGDGMGSFASGRFYTEVGVSAQHELLRNLLLGADISYSNDDYEGIDREDNVFKLGLNANYMMHRNLYLRGGYKLNIRESDVAGADYVENVVFVRLQVQY